MPKEIGLSRNIKLKWLNHTVNLITADLSEIELKQELNQYLSLEIASSINIRKTREIILRMWSYGEENEELRNDARMLIEEDPLNEMAIHWCIMLLVFPIFVDASKMIGRLVDFQDEFSFAQLKVKLFDQWGERTTVMHSFAKIIATMKDFGVLSTIGSGKYGVIQHSISNQRIVNYMIIIAMIVTGKSYYTFSELSELDILFPFTYDLNKENLLQDERFAVNTFGGEQMLSLKKPVSYTYNLG